MREQGSGTESGEAVRAPRTLAETAFNEGQRLARDPNICAVGYGIKLRGGEPAAGSGGCLVYFVRQKLRSQKEIADRETWSIADRVDDFVTDVVEVGQLEAASADRAQPANRRGTLVGAPLVGGTATMGLGTQVPGPGGYGTIGGVCFDSLTNSPLLLSNAHVWGRTVGTEVIQPVIASTVFGAQVTPAITGTPPTMVQTRIPAALTAPVVFANSVAQTVLIAGSEDDPQVFGQGATAVPATTRTVREQVVISVAPAGLAPAGRRLSVVPSWAYQRLSSASAAQVTSSVAHTPSKLLAARRLFSNAASYSAGQTVNLYAEVIPASGGVPATASAHFPLVLLYPFPAGGKFIPRLLRPAARQVPTTVTTQFTGFPAPSRLGSVNLPFTVAGGFTIDSASPATFQAANAGTLPAGTLALKLPAGAVRVFVPPSTQVVLDIDLRASVGALSAQAVNSAGDNVGTVNIPAPGSSGRTLVTIDASEIVELRLTIAGTVVLYGVTSKRASPETTAPLSYAGSISADELLPKGKWGASLFVQATDSGITESANLIETAIGLASLSSDCTFDTV